MDELDKLITALEGRLDSLKSWTAEELALASHGENHCDHKREAAHSDENESPFSWRTEEILATSRSGCPSSHVSSEVVQSECLENISHDPVSVKGAKVEQGGSIDLNLVVMSIHHERQSLHATDFYDSKAILAVAETNPFIGKQEKVSSSDAMEIDIAQGTSYYNSSAMCYDHLNMKLVGHTSAFSNKLFGVDLLFPAPPNGLKNEMTDRSDSRISLAEQINLSNTFVACVEPLNFGSVMFGKLWCNNTAIFPKGFRSRVKFYSILDPRTTCSYISEVLDAGFLGPLFKVSLEECPKETFTSVSAEKCWEMVLQQLNKEIGRRNSIGESGLPPLQSSQSINGLEMFGFLSPPIVKAIESLDPNHECKEYWNSRLAI